MVGSDAAQEGELHLVSTGSKNRRPDWRPCIESLEERQALRELASARAGEVRLAERALIILMAAAGATAAEIAEEAGVRHETALKWCRRFTERRRESPDKPVKHWLSDAPRVGRPNKYDELFWVDVLAIATSDPDSNGRPITQWTCRELTDEVIEQKLAESIHFTTVARFLAECDLKPQCVDEWMNRKPDPEFDVRATDIKDCVVAAVSDPTSDRATVSFDEKTGMQAKERVAADKPMQPGRPARHEFEYKRHGTLVLFGMMLVNTGKILATTDTLRTNPVTANVLSDHFRQLFDDGYKHIDVLLDQLNTHWSIDLVKSVAELCNLPVPLDTEIAKGAQRRDWLSDPDKSIVFHFTPKHASWLNPIEIWFGVLVRKVLRRGSFKSTTNLAGKVQKFVGYYNEKLAHPYRFNKWRKVA